MEWNKQTQQYVIGGAVVIVVALLGWWFFTGAPKDGAMENENGTSTQATTTTGTSTGSMEERPTTGVNTGEEVHVNDQPAGDSVRVAEARLSRVSWIAVRDDLTIYGAARVSPPQGGGTITDVSVPLLKNTEAGKTYKVVVYADDGDGAFDFKKDALVTGLDDTFSALSGN